MTALVARTIWSQKQLPRTTVLARRQSHLATGTRVSFVKCHLRFCSMSPAFRNRAMDARWPPTRLSRRHPGDGSSNSVECHMTWTTRHGRRVAAGCHHGVRVAERSTSRTRGRYDSHMTLTLWRVYMLGITLAVLGWIGLTTLVQQLRYP